MTGGVRSTCRITITFTGEQQLYSSKFSQTLCGKSKPKSHLVPARKSFLVRLSPLVKELLSAPVSNAQEATLPRSPLVCKTCNLRRHFQYQYLSDRPDKTTQSNTDEHRLCMHGDMFDVTSPRLCASSRGL